MGHPCRIRRAGAGAEAESPVAKILRERRSTKGHTPGPFRRTMTNKSYVALRTSDADVASTPYGQPAKLASAIQH